MRTSVVSVVAALILIANGSTCADAPTSKTLEIYLVDVEGGNATLFVAPSGGSLLIDTGNGGAAAVRDADRIMAAVKDAGIRQIDHLITTHWHGDHFGAMAEVAGRIPIRNFIDHGPNVQPGAADAFLKDTYPTLYTPKPSTRSPNQATGYPSPAWTSDWLLPRVEAIKTAVAGHRETQSLLRGLQTPGRRQNRKCTVCGQRDHIREIPRIASGRS